MRARISQIKAVVSRVFRRQPATTVGLDIGSGSIKVAEVGWNQNQPELRAAGIIELPVNTFKDGYIVNEPLLLEALRQILTISGVTSKNVVLSLRGQALVIRELLFPDMSVEELQQAIKWDLDKYVTTANASDYYFDFATIEASKDTHEIRVLLVAAPLAMITGLVSLARKLGLKPLAVDIEPLALQRTMEQASNVIIIDIGAEFCQVNLFQQGSPLVSRLIPLGGNRYTETIMRELKLNFAEAERLKQQKELLVADNQADERLAYLQQSLQLLIEELAREVRRTVDYYQMQNRNAIIEKIILTGGGTKLSNLAFTLTQQLPDIPVIIHTPLLSLPISPSLDDKWLKRIELQIAVAVGLALRRGGDG
ncbi:type IV pilus assembly protein PilM [Sporomusa acidovorans]|uniref:Cell division protein FtsA n=1 Tax=Sporomusa acidovorans (strain ATCC 49682 / DSM 3132 / Mol) TaxID=1123286 RepID=A0ABZ3J0Y2_SPOA4|nr:type IV pilus assembly protein PilM [Sporomusa acidovorans]OZC15028.1 cell division protein FtsA [Sporomusa acidovorans DSM 3132]SDE84328.1 type IV pilus assembly protein PilM [Sporomusa acidovorans]